MIHGIFKEHQVHGSNEVIVRRQGFFQQFFYLGPIPNGEVLGVADALSEVAIDQRLLEHRVLVVILMS